MFAVDAVELLAVDVELSPESVTAVAVKVPFEPEVPERVTLSPGSTDLPVTLSDFFSVVLGSSFTLTVLPSDSFT